MTAWVTALVPLVVALVSAARWPTLAKRIRDHAAMVKELPPEAAQELQPLLVAEVRSLAERDRRRLDRRVNWVLNVRRVGVTTSLSLIAVTISILSYFWTPSDTASPDTSSRLHYDLATTFLVPLAIAVLMASAPWLYFRRQRRKELLAARQRRRERQ